MHASTQIESLDRSPEHVFRSYLVELSVRKTWQKNRQVATFVLGSLDAEVRAEVAAYRDANEWLRKALAKGPVTPLPMPDHVQAIPMALPI